MLYAQVELDVSQIMSWGKPAAIAVLSAVAFFTLVLPQLKYGAGGLPGKLLDRLKDAATNEGKGPTKNYKRKDTDRSSDEPPPPCFAAHLQIIEDTAPNANPKTWWKYAKEELTEAEVAIAEARLARRLGEDDEKAEA
jgi:hypothetical protein